MLSYNNVMNPLFLLVIFIILKGNNNPDMLTTISSVLTDENNPVHTLLKENKVFDKLPKELSMLSSFAPLLSLLKGNKQPKTQENQDSSATATEFKTTPPTTKPMHLSPISNIADKNITYVLNRYMNMC